MYFISTAFEQYCSNKRSDFTNLVNNPINGKDHLFKIDSLHIQKKVDIIDDEVIFIVFRLRKKMPKGKESSTEGKRSLIHYSIKKSRTTCIACLKILKGYYTAREFVRAFNVFSVEFLDSKLIFKVGDAGKNKDKIILNVRGATTEVYPSRELITSLGFNETSFKNMNESLLNSVKFQAHKNIFKHKENFYFKKIKTGVYKPEKYYDKGKYLPQLIKIYSDQVEGTIESESIRKLVGVMPGFNENDCTKYDYYPVNPLIVKLRGAFVNSFRFILTNESCEQLKLSSGFATYIKASLLPAKPKNEMTSEEYITCLSSDTTSKTMYPKNVNNAFTITLPKVLHKGPYRKWYMSLLNISMPSITPNIHEGENKIVIYDDENIQTSRISIDEGYYDNADEILHAMTWSMKNTEVFIELSDNGRFSFTNTGNGKKTLKISTNLALILGLINDVTGKLVIKLELDPQKPFISDFEPDMKITDYSYCKLTCDQLTSTYFGDNNEEILRFLPLQKVEKHPHYFQEFYHRIKVEINSSTLSNLSFRLTKENSTDLVNFQNRDISTHLTLLIEREN